MSQFSLPLVLGIGLSLLLTPVSRRIALRIGAIDYPGERRIHLLATPRFCGPGILLGLVVALLLAGFLDAQVGAILDAHLRRFVALAIGAVIITSVGAVDDVHPLRPRTKLCVEIVAAILVVQSGYRIDSDALRHLEILSFLISVAFIVVTVNAVNLLDGLDGLAVGVCLVIGATLFMLGIHHGATDASLVLAALCGVLVGFLPYNFYPARIFLGDSGALLLGFMLSVGAISTSRQANGMGTAAAPLLALGLPLGELALTTIRRVLREVKVKQVEMVAERYRWFFLRRPALFTADRDHIHHRLLNLGFIHRGVVLLLYVVCAIFCGTALMFTYHRAMRPALLLSLAVGCVAGLRKLAYPELMPLRSGLLLPLFGSRAFSSASVAGERAAFSDHIELAAQRLHPQEPERRGA